MKLRDKAMLGEFFESEINDMRLDNQECIREEARKFIRNCTRIECQDLPAVGDDRAEELRMEKIADLIVATARKIERLREDYFSLYDCWRTIEDLLSDVPTEY